MALWKRYGYAIVRGALRCIPLAGPILEEIIQVVEEQGVLQNDDVVTVLEEATIHIQMAEQTSEDAEQTITIEASQAWTALPEDTQKSLRKKAKLIFAEDELDLKKELTAGFVVELSQSLLKIPSFQDSLSQAVSITGEPASSPVKAPLGTY